MLSLRRLWPFGRRQTLWDQCLRGKISREQYQALLRQRLLSRVERDISQGNTTRAINRLEGHRNMDVFNAGFIAGQRRQLAALYLQTGQPVKAGKYLYLVDHLNLEEAAAVAAFEQSLGNCPVGISKKLSPKRHFSYHRLDAYARQRYANLIGQIEARFGVVPHFLTAFKFQLDKYGLKPNNIN